MTDIILTKTQQEALKKFSSWFRDKKSKQCFRLFGYAGTGKTALAKYFAKVIGNNVAYAAFTGKAADVMRKNGCDGAQTIHSLIYVTEIDKHGNFKVYKNINSNARIVDLIIIDECSMVDDEMANDLLSFGTKILVLGDPAQLPPIDGTGFFIKDEPDVLLTEIHRQTENNPIIVMATAVRHGYHLEYGEYGDSKVLNDIDLQEMLSADQVIVGKNDTRETVTKIYRSEKGYTDQYPDIGEKLICLKNDRTLGIFNGQMFTVVSKPKHVKYDFLMIDVKAEGSNMVKSIKVHKSFFNSDIEKPFWKYLSKTQEFYWGWAISCHKSQGSQWDNVYIIDEARVFRENRYKWLYTAITRASKKVTIVS
jgi:ATP-dependent exoDNAse (exonuclease V) alpha subunit